MGPARWRGGGGARRGGAIRRRAWTTRRRARCGLASEVSALLLRVRGLAPAARPVRCARRWRCRPARRRILGVCYRRWYILRSPHANDYLRGPDMSWVRTARERRTRVRYVSKNARPGTKALRHVGPRPSARSRRIALQRRHMVRCTRRSTLDLSPSRVPRARQATLARKSSQHSVASR